MAPKKVVIVGGGLAGMVVAKELLKRKEFQVVILEATERMGGKAGADLIDGIYYEHGYHMFPAWYLNTRKLLEEIGVDGDLIDLHQQHYIDKIDTENVDPFKTKKTLHGFNLKNFKKTCKNLRSGLLPIGVMLVLIYFLVDLISHSIRTKRFLDKVSLNGLLHSRLYASERLAGYQYQSTLQASSIPSHEISAGVIRNLSLNWLTHPEPWISIFNGNLQEKFIIPFEKYVEDLSPDPVIFKEHEVKKLKMHNGKVASITVERRLESQDGDEWEEYDEAGDIFVLATPLEVTRRFVDDEIQRTERANTNSEEKLLSNLVHLESAPMAAMTIYLNRPLDGMPEEHTFLNDSRYSMSFIDVSRHWNYANPIICAIASNFKPLETLLDNSGPDAAKKSMLQELQRYLKFEDSDIDGDRCKFMPNNNVPLFINTVGSEELRPDARTRIRDLYVAGDYCQSEADLATMESAVMSSLRTAQCILQDNSMDDDVGLIPLKKDWKLIAGAKALKLLFFGPAVIFSKIYSVTKLPRTSGSS